MLKAIKNQENNNPNKQRAGAKENYNTIDLVKLISAILVVAIHIPIFGTSTSGFSMWANFLISNYIARLAVPFFFISAGFFLFKKTDITRPDRIIIFKYIKHIVVLYFFWSLIYFPIIIKNIINDGYTTLPDIFLQYLYSYIIKGINTQLWYLPSLIIAIIMIVLLGKKLKLSGMLILACFLYFLGLFSAGWYGFIEPLKNNAPWFCNIINYLINYIGATRFGIFEGYLFVLIGGICANYEINLSANKAKVFFLVSLLLMFSETLMLKKYNIACSYSMTLFMAPTVFFMFILVAKSQIKIDGVSFSSFRTYSSIIYFIHLFIEVLLLKTASVFGIELDGTVYDFFITLFMCFLIALVVNRYVLKHKWLKKFF